MAELADQEFIDKDEMSQMLAWLNGKPAVEVARYVIALEKRVLRLSSTAKVVAFIASNEEFTTTAPIDMIESVFGRKLK
jgi:hypothetical protein